MVGGTVGGQCLLRVIVAGPLPILISSNKEVMAGNRKGRGEVVVTEEVGVTPAHRRDMAVGHPTRLKGCPRRSNSIRWEEETRAVDFFPAWLAGCGGPTTPSQRGDSRVTAIAMAGEAPSMLHKENLLRDGSRPPGLEWRCSPRVRAAGPSSRGTRDRMVVTAGDSRSLPKHPSITSIRSRSRIMLEGAVWRTAAGWASGRGSRARFSRETLKALMRDPRGGYGGIFLYCYSFVLYTVLIVYSCIFRPKGSILLKKKKEDEDAGRMANGSGQAFGGPGAFGNPYPSFAGPPGMGIGPGDTALEPSGPGVPEVISVDDSIVLVLKPNELAKKKRKFKQDGANRLQVITTFDHCLTGFHAKDGKGPCLKTTDILEQNQHVMLPEAAKKVRFLRSDFKRRMEADGKGMSPEDRVAALEDNLRKVYSVVSMEGGVHMNSIGPAIESQLDSIPLRAGVEDMTAALAWRAIPMTIFCAGYGNVAMEVLRRGSPRITGPGGIFTPHLRLVANFFRPDDTMTIIGMYDTVPLIHEAKKSGATLMEFLRGVGHENVFASRSNVLLLGAELSDLGLAGGLPAVEERISVGFLKLDEHVMEKLPRYAQAYDVVIIGDGDMSYTNEILHEIVG
ncbi:unnamed protein product [Ascophyllum nodosum]